MQGWRGKMKGGGGGRDGLVAVERQVTRGESSFTQKFWVKPEDVKASDKPVEKAAKVGEQARTTERQQIGRLSKAKGSSSPKAEEKKAAAATPSPATPTEGRKWVAKLDHLPEDTLKHHTKDGKLTPERQKLHDSIKAKTLDRVPRVPDDEKPIAVLMMGAPASGKSTLAKRIPEARFVRVDPDGIKEKLPEYHEAMAGNAKNAAAMVHEESSHLAKQIREEAISGRKNLLVDGTGKNAETYGALIKRLQGEGYHVRVMMAHLDKDEGMRRMKARADVTGRYVPDEFVNEAYEKIPRNFPHLAGLADEAQLFDMGGAEPKPTWTRSGDTETAHDEKAYKDFHVKYSRGK